MSKPDRNEVTEFQSKCYKFISNIPLGYVMSYGDVALHLGTCARAVGTAMKRNPYAPRVPCHRVILSDRTLGGFSGSLQEASTKRKRSLLEMEGVKFDSNGRVSESCIYHLPFGTSATTSGGSKEWTTAVGDDTLSKITQETTNKSSTNGSQLSLSEKSTLANDKVEKKKISAKHKKLRRCDGENSHFSPMYPAVSQDELEKEILNILHSRERGKTC